MSSEPVELRPGDTLNIIWTSVQETPFGPQEMESNFQFTYDELLTKLKSSATKSKSRRSGTNGARFSRIVALAFNAIKKGKWSTGANIDTGEVFDKLAIRFDKLEPDEYQNITENAKKSLLQLAKNDSFLSSENHKRLLEMIDKIGLIH